MRTITIFAIVLLLISCNQIDDVSKTYDNAKKTTKTVEEIKDKLGGMVSKEELNDIIEINNSKLLDEVSKKTQPLEQKTDALETDVTEHNTLVNNGKEYSSIFLYILSVLGLITVIKLFGKSIVTIASVKLINAVKSDPFSFQNSNNKSLAVRTNKSLDIKVCTPLNIRKGSIIKYIDNAQKKTTAPFRSKLHLITKNLFLWDKVKFGEITLTAPINGCFVSEVIVPENEIFVFNFNSLLAFESNKKIHSIFKLNMSKILENRYFFHYIKGPVKIYLFGFGEIVNEKIAEKASFENYAVIGYSGALKRDLSVNCGGLVDLFTNKNLFKEDYLGKGEILRQSVGMTPKQVTKMSVNENTWIDYLNAIIGLK